jgi:Glyoxalase-like domain
MPAVVRSTRADRRAKPTQSDGRAGRTPLAIVRLMLTRVDMTMDAADPDRLAEFWKAALGYVDEPPPAPFTDRREWIRSFGEEISDDEPIGAAWLVDPNGIAPRLSILPVPEPKTAKNRLHLDLRVAADTSPGQRRAVLQAEVDRLIAAGASVLWSIDDHHVTLADPEGNEFCIA